MSAQTGHVIVISSDEDMINLIQGAKPKMVDKETDTSDLEEMNLTTQIKSMERKIEEKFDMIASFLHQKEKEAAISTHENDRESATEHKFKNKDQLKETDALADSVSIQSSFKNTQKLDEEIGTQEDIGIIPENREQLEEETETQQEEETETQEAITLIGESAENTEPLSDTQLDSAAEINNKQEYTEYGIEAEASEAPSSSAVLACDRNSNNYNDIELENRHPKLNPTVDEAVLERILKLLQARTIETKTDNVLPKTCKKSIDFTVVDKYQGVQVINDFTAERIDHSTPNTAQTGTPNGSQQALYEKQFVVVNVPEESKCDSPGFLGYQEVNQDMYMSPVSDMAVINATENSNHIVEISKPEDIRTVPSHATVRVVPSVVNTIYESSHAFGPFGWNLVKAIYKKEERLGRSFNGNSNLKPPISPRRKQAVLVAIENMAERFEVKDALIKNANDCIVNGLRNEARHRIVFSELTPKMQNRLQLT